MKLNTYLYSLLASVLLLFAACTPDEYELGSKQLTPEDLVEGVAFTITHDTENPNIVYLESLLGSNYKPLWETPQGRSQEKLMTLRIPFEGTYEVTFGVETRGGIVYGAPATFTIDSFCADFVTDELWTFLTGGVGAEKVWIYDDGSYGYAAGELTYADPSSTVEWNNWSPNWDPGKGHTGDDAIWASTMTFDLINGANVRVHNVSSSGETDTQGTFMLNTDNHTITFTDCDLLHTPSWSDRSSNWRRDLQILELDENHLRIGVMRDNSEGPWWLIWNFVSKEFADNYVPEDQPDPEPALPDGWEDAISEVVTTKITWSMSADVPFDWANLDGSLMNNFTAGNYPDWATPVANLNQLSMTLDSGDNSYEFTMPDGTSVSGTYELDEKGIYTFDNGVPSYHIGGGDIMFAATAENQLRVLQVNMLGDMVADIWLGQRSTEKDEYIAYHFIPAAAAGNEPEYTYVTVDNSKLNWGHLEGSTNNFRIELYNIFGSTGGQDDAGNPLYTDGSPFDPMSIAFTSQIEVTFTVSGLNGAAATGEYDAGLMLTGTGWWPQYAGTADTTIKGDGTYTITAKPGAAVNGVIVFCIDFFEMASDLDDPDAVSITIDSIGII